MKTMSSSPVEPADLIDLKLLPAWVKESAERRSFEHYTGEDREGPRDGRRSSRDKRDREFKHSAFKARRPFKSGKPDAHGRKKPGRGSERVGEPGRGTRQRLAHAEDRRSRITRTPLEITIRFLPDSRVFENVAAQIKSGSVAYSVFALARLFLEKPERYEVRLTAKEGSPLYQLGE